MNPCLLSNPWMKGQLFECVSQGRSVVLQTKFRLVTHEEHFLHDLAVPYIEVRGLRQSIETCIGDRIQCRLHTLSIVLNDMS